MKHKQQGGSAGTIWELIVTGLISAGLSILICMLILSWLPK